MKRVTALLLILFASVINAAPVIYQAENGTLNGTNIATALAGYQGTGYVTGFDNAGDYCQVTVNVALAGMYTITLGYAATMGDKINDLYVNGVFQAGVSFPSTSGFSSVTAGIVPLNAGNNTLRIQNNWGYFFLDWFGVEAAVLPPLNVPDSLVNANSSAATKCLMSYLVSNYGVKTIAGQDTVNSAEWLNTNTGKYPALCGFDMMDYSPSRVAYGAADPLQVEQAIAWYQSGGIVQFQWHWNAPSGLLNTVDHEWWRGFYTHATTFDVEYAMNNPASQEYQDIIRDIDAIAVQLLRLRDAGVPVLWRPLHEAQGGWFWWGAKGYAPCMALYELVYDRLTNHHGLNNLIWVWTSEDNASAINWYPGNSKVDVVGADIYLSGLNYSPSTAMFYNLVNLTGGQKLVAMTENGTIPDPDAMEAQNAHWSWFMTWNGYQNNTAQNTLAHVQYVYNHSYITTRDELSGVYACASPTQTMTMTATLTQTSVWTPTPSVTQSATATYTAEETATLTQTVTFTQTQSFTPFDTATETMTVTPTPTSYALTGTIVFATDRTGDWEIFKRDLATGIETNLTNNPGYDDLEPCISPDGQYMVYAADTDGDFELYRMNLTTYAVEKLTDNDYSDRKPVISPHGDTIAFLSTRYGGSVDYPDIYTMDWNLKWSMRALDYEQWLSNYKIDFGFNNEQLLYSGSSKLLVLAEYDGMLIGLSEHDWDTGVQTEDFDPAANRQNQKVYFVSASGRSDLDIHTVNADATGRSLLVSLPGDERNISFSSDFTVMVFTNNGDGDFDLYHAFSDGAGVVKIADTSSNDIWPVFIPDTAPEPTHTPTQGPTPGCVVKDISFGDGGIVERHNDAGGKGKDRGYYSVLDSSGRLLVLGMSQAPDYPAPDRRMDYKMIIWRFLPDGNPDTSFNGTGMVILDTGYNGFSINESKIALDNSGRIVVAASVYYLGLTVFRLNQDGTSDTTFGAGTGKIDHWITGCADIKFSEDSKIVLLCNRQDSMYYVYDYAVLRLNDDGTTDNGFGSSGIVVFDYPAYGLSYDYSEGLIVEPGGKVVVVGRSWTDDIHKTVVFRLGTDGNFDTTFGGLGYVSIDDVECVSIMPYAGGKYLLGGYNRNVKTGCVWRLNNDGSADTSLNGTGESVIPEINWYVKLVSADTYGRIMGIVSWGDTVLRLGTDLNLDYSFNGCGFVKAHEFNTAIALSASGSDVFYLAGFSKDRADYNMMVIKYEDTCPIPPSPTPSLTITATPTITPSITATVTETVTITETATITETHTVSPTVTPTVTGTPPTLTVTPTVTETASLTVTLTPTFTITETATTTYTHTQTVTQTITETITQTLQSTATATPTATRTATPTPTRTRTVAPTATRTPTPAVTPTQTPVAESSVLSITLAESYPNPVIASAGTNVKFDYWLTKTLDSVKITIYTGSYRKVMEKKIPGPVPVGRSSAFADVSGFAPGIYYWQAEAVSGEQKARSKPQVMVILR